MPISLLLLNRLPLLAGLPEATLAPLAQVMGLRELARREVVFNKGAVGECLYFLLDGRLQGVDFTLDGREAGLYFVNPGDYFGELALIDGEPQAEFVVALARSRIATLPRDEARQLIFSTPVLAERVMAGVARRLRQAAAQRTLLTLPSPAQRVCAQLLVLGVDEAGGRSRITHAPTHQELAIMINSSRETVTRIFQMLLGGGVLRRVDDDLLIEDPLRLRAVAEGREELSRGG